MADVVAPHQISDARRALDTEPRILRTPTLYSAGLSAYLRQEYGHPVHVFLKLESLQTTRSYKIRGAYNKVTRVVDFYGKGGLLVAASAGNHAQGVAFSADAHGIQTKTTIFMPADAPDVKKKGTRAYGVTVDDRYKNFDEAREAANRAAEAPGTHLIHPYDDPEVMAGQGTVAIEILESLAQDPVYQAARTLGSRRTSIICPVGGGGLLSGIVTWVKNEDPDVRVIGVEPVGSAKTRRSLAEGKNFRRDSLMTMADGVRVLQLGEKTYEVIRTHLGAGDICNVSETRIRRAIRRLSVEGLVTEGAGALALAALMDNQDRDGGAPEYAPDETPPLALVENECVVLVVSGANLKAEDLLIEVAFRVADR